MVNSGGKTKISTKLQQNKIIELKTELSLNLNTIDCSINDKTRAIYSKKFIESSGKEKNFYHNKRVILFKTEMCRSFNELGYCKYGDRCQFCHSTEELRDVKRHPKYKTEICKTFWNDGSCPYGGRCCFIHLENDKLQSFNSKISIYEHINKSQNDTIKDSSNTKISIYEHISKSQNDTIKDSSNTKISIYEHINKSQDDTIKHRNLNQNIGAKVSESLICPYEESKHFNEFDVIINPICESNVFDNWKYSLDFQDANSQLKKESNSTKASSNSEFESFCNQKLLIDEKSCRISTYNPNLSNYFSFNDMKILYPKTNYISEEEAYYFKLSTITSEIDKELVLKSFRKHRSKLSKVSNFKLDDLSFKDFEEARMLEKFTIYKYRNKDANNRLDELGLDAMNGIKGTNLVSFWKDNPISYIYFCN